MNEQKENNNSDLPLPTAPALITASALLVVGYVAGWLTPREEVLVRIKPTVVVSYYYSNNLAFRIVNNDNAIVKFDGTNANGHYLKFDWFWTGKPGDTNVLQRVDK